ncbi:MAG: SpoIID/LytB domain-containing protein [Bacteroidales bacterium]|nr:SpoIID/LytB domain-containing protein [Bacteroidales bacterium]
MKFILITILIFAFSFNYGQKLKIAVFYNQKISSIIISTYLGKYEIWGDEQFFTDLKQNDVFQCTILNDSIEIKNVSGLSRKFKQIELRGAASINVAKYKPIIPSLSQRYYDDNMTISIQNGSLFFLNFVEMDNYICGVVESESGYQVSKEFYKTQAILCRTFALENIGKHYSEGFHLCDGVHCQAYKGKNYSLSYHSIISEAVTETHDLVIVDSSNMVITAAFHANCGGQTVNSEDVWGKPKSYLRSVTDNYCQYQRNSQWEKSISMNEWQQFLLNNYPQLATKNYSWSFYQTTRKGYFRINNDSIWLRKVREYFQLRSTFFSIYQHNDSIVFKGKGFGHGVGLCQDGAIQMAKKGFNAIDIIRFYYKNVKIISFKEIPFYQSILPSN